MLPDMAAGCSMADMAGIRQIEDAWDELSEVIDTEQLIPVTYINSACQSQGLRRPTWRHRLHQQQCQGGSGVGVR